MKPCDRFGCAARATRLVIFEAGGSTRHRQGVVVYLCSQHFAYIPHSPAGVLMRVPDLYTGSPGLTDGEDMQ